MVHKKIASLFLFLFFQSFCMLTVNQQRWRKQYPQRIEDYSSPIENYKFNEQFFCTKMPRDIVGYTINFLDYKSNIQFIRTCKYLYEKYASGEPHKSLFTNHYLSSDDYAKAMIHYARRNDEERVELLIQHEGEENRNNREAILRYFKMADADNLQTVINIYKQVFPSEVTKFDTIIYGENGFYNEYCINFKDLTKNAALLQLLLKQGLSPHIKNDQNKLLFLEVSNHFLPIDEKDRLKLIKVLLSDLRTNPNIQDENGKTALRGAISWGENEIVKILLADSRTNPTTKDKDGNTVLKDIKWDNHEIVEILLKNPWVNPNMPDEYGNFALIRAIEKNNIEAVKLLLTNPQTNPNIRGEYGDFVLIEAVKKNNVKVVKLLLANSQTDPNIRGKYGDIALIKAIKKNNVKVVKLLLANSQTDPNIRGKYGDIALILATKQNNIEIVKILLADNRTDPNVCDYFLDSAYYHAKDPEMVRILSEKTSFFAKDKFLICYTGMSVGVLLFLALHDKYTTGIWFPDAFFNKSN